jgi:hypothetical protein
MTELTLYMKSLSASISAREVSSRDSFGVLIILMLKAFVALIKLSMMSVIVFETANIVYLTK